MKKYFLPLFLLSLVLAAGQASAATATNNLVVSASVTSACQITSVGNINFGAYDPLSATPKDAAGNVVLRCVKGTSYKAYITGTRSMTGGSDSLNFQLYTDAGRTATFPIDNTVGGTTSASSSPVTKDVYGRIAAGQDVSAASYTATLVATVEY